MKFSSVRSVSTSGPHVCQTNPLISICRVWWFFFVYSIPKQRKNILLKWWRSQNSLPHPRRQKLLENGARCNPLRGSGNHRRYFHALRVIVWIQDFSYLQPTALVVLVWPRLDFFPCLIINWPGQVLQASLCEFDSLVGHSSRRQSPISEITCLAKGNFGVTIINYWVVLALA